MSQYELNCRIPFGALVFFEEAFEEIGSATLNSLIETGQDKGLWQFQVIFEEKPKEDDIQNAIREASRNSGTAQPEWVLQALPDKNWLRESYVSFPPMVIGRYFIYGSHITDVPADKITLKIDAATAFGTGEHQTTHGCLQALDELLETHSFKSVIDVGCGSGILAMAYAKATGHSVDATDIDPESVNVTIQNAHENGLEKLLSVWQSDGYDAITKSYDLILCNILARPLMEMAPDLEKHLNAKGYAILSGFLNRQERWVLSAHEKAGLKFIKSIRIKGWSTLVLQKV
ncbi:MAG: 50S ribosomal protein L11 methyltransferase [Lactobacillales bacterium]|nr:50S ribosomal protein L11 methyltransferase [Lactobacillales bacterium]